MEFYRPKNKKREVPIIPLIDILVTLLFFFIVSMAPKQRRSMLEIHLPRTESIQARTVSDSITVLSVDPSGKSDLNGEGIPSGFLKEYLIANRTQAPNEKLEIRMDRECTLEQIIKVQDDVRAAGYEKGQVYHRVLKQTLE